MTNRKYSSEEKAAVLAALLEGQAISHVADTYNIPVGTVKGWKHREINSESPSAVVTQKRNEIGDKIMILLAAELDMLAGMVVTFSDPVWLRKQTAADVAVLYGVIQDKAIRKLEALGNAATDG